MTNIELLVEMGQLPARVHEEEFSVYGTLRHEDVAEHERPLVGEDVCRVRFPDHNPEGNEKLEFAHKSEGDAEHDSNGIRMALRPSNRNS